MRITFLYNDASQDPAGLAEDSDPDRSPIVRALRGAGHDVTALACTLDLSSLRDELEQLRPDVVFNRVESLGGSDALATAVPLVLDTHGVPYTGCSTAAIVAAANKVTVKQRLVAAHLPTPRWVDLSTIRERGQLDLKPSPFGRGLVEGASVDGVLPSPQPSPRGSGGLRFILKSVLEHASFAIDDNSIIVADDEQQINDCIRAREACFDRPYFAEEFIDGREFNLALLGDGTTVLPAAEIDFSAFPVGKPRIVGRGAKFDAGSFEFENTPRRFDFPESDRVLLRRLCGLAAECGRLFELAGYARVDFRVDADGQPWILEINTNPCLAPGSGFAAALAQAGIGYDEGILRIVDEALRRGPRSDYQAHVSHSAYL